MTIKNTIDTYRKRRRQMVPLILGVIAVLLVVAGIIIVTTSLSGTSITLFASKTPTATITPSPTITITLTQTPTITFTPTITSTPTAAEIYSYVVKEGESLTSIIESQGLADTPNAIILILMLNPTIDPNFITVGQTILLPPPNYPLPTSTPLPTGLAPGSRITYTVLPGDSLNSIATNFNSTIADIVNMNKDALTEGETSTIYPGQKLIVRVNLVAPVPTTTLTATPTQ
jgi:LysM repeat protein